jgi:hypothetical protein
MANKMVKRKKFKKSREEGEFSTMVITEHWIWIKNQKKRRGYQKHVTALYRYIPAQVTPPTAYAEAALTL